MSGERSLIYLSATEEVEEEVEEEVTVVTDPAGGQATEVKATTTTTERWQERQRIEGTMIEVPPALLTLTSTVTETDRLL
jgi:hypothetical protein